MAKSAELQLILSAKDQASSKIQGVKGALDGLASVGTKLGVGAAGAVTAIGAGAVKLAKDAAGIPGVAASFEGLGGSIEKMREGSLGMVSDVDLMKSFNTAAQLVSQDFAQQLPEAMGYLSKVSAATGQDMGYMIDSMVKGVGRLSPMILDNLGIQVSLEEAMARASEMYGVSTEELTKEQQQAGMMNVVMEKLAANTADMPEVMGSAAQQSASFDVQLQNLKDSVGVGLLPVLTELLTWLTGFLAEHGPQFTAWVQTAATWITGTLVPGIQGLVEGLKPFVDKVAEFVSQHSEEFKAALIAIGALLAAATIASGIISITTAIAAMANPITLIVAAVALLAAAWAGDWGGIRTTIMEVWAKVEPVFQQVVQWFQTNIPVALAALKAIWDSVWPSIQVVLEGVWNAIQITIETVIGIVRGIIQTVMALIQGDWDGAWTAIKGTAETYLNGISAFITNILNTILGLFGTDLETLKTTVTEKFTAIKQAISDKINDFKQAGRDLIMGLISGVKEKAGELLNAVKEVVSNAVNGVKNFLGIQSPSTVFAEIGAQMVAGIPVGMDKEKASVLEKLGDWINSIVNAFTVLRDSSKAGAWSMDAVRAQVDAVEMVLTYAIDRFQHLQNLFGYDKIKTLQNTAKRFTVILGAVMVDLSGVKDLEIPDVGAWFATLERVFGLAMTMLARINAQYGKAMLEEVAAASGLVTQVLGVLGANLEITPPPVNFPIVLAAFLAAVAAGAPLIIDALMDVQGAYGDVLGEAATAADSLNKVMGTLGIGKLIDELTLTKKLEKGEKRLPFIKALTALLADLSKGADILIPAMLALDAKYGGVLEIVTSVTDKIKAAFGGVADAAKSAGEIAGAKFNLKDFGAGLARFQKATALTANAFAGPQMAMTGGAAGGGGATFPSTITMRLTLDIPSMGLASDETDVTIDTKTGIAAAQNLTLHASSKGV